MKLWLKYVIATIAGLILGILLPVYGGDTGLFFERSFIHIVHIGRYLIFPLLFFTIVTGSHELCGEKRLQHIYGRMMGYTLISTILLTVIGALFIALFSPDRVPIIIEEAVINLPPSLSDQILLLFPKNLFTIFAGAGDFLLPLLFFAVIFGIALYYYRPLSNVVVDTFEDLSQIFYKMNRAVLEILSLGIFFMAAYRIIQLRDMLDLDLFSRLLLVIILATAIIIFLIIPALLYFLGNRRQNPYTWLFATLPVALSALLSGNSYFTIGPAIGVLNKNMGLDRKKTAAMVSLGAIFSRSGVAMVTCMSFILILRSYSSLDITFFQYLWVIGSSILISFLLGTAPANSIVVSLAYISGWYAQGLQDGFLILLPAAPILTSLAVLLDTMILLLTCQLTIDQKKTVNPAKPLDFL